MTSDELRIRANILQDAERRETTVLFLPRRLESLHDGFRKLLGHRDGTHVDNDVIDLAIFVEVHLIDRLKVLALELALKDK